MTSRSRPLDPHASPAALFGAELRSLRARRGLSQAGLGRLVHVSGDLISKIEKAERAVLPALAERLDEVLEAGGRLRALGAELHDDDVIGGRRRADVHLAPESCHRVLTTMVDTARRGDHAMTEHADAAVLVAYARAAESVLARMDVATRRRVGSAIGEAYQLAGWVSFDHGRPRRAERLFATSRAWAERAEDRVLAAYVLGPNLSFTATYSGRPAIGVELAYAALGWARRSGNRRLAAFTLAISARAHARLGETNLCFGLLEEAGRELDAHRPDEHDAGWLSVFDHAALDGHRGSCHLDLDRPDHALTPLQDVDGAAPGRFVRNRVIWRLDRIDALLRLGEVEQAATELLAAASIPSAGAITPRVRHRFRATALGFAGHPWVEDVLARVRELTEAPG